MKAYEVYRQIQNKAMEVQEALHAVSGQTFLTTIPVLPRCKSEMESDTLHLCISVTDRAAQK